MPETLAFITNLCCMKRAHYSKRMLCKSFAGILHDRVFRKQLWWFLRCGAGKKIQISSSRWWRFQLATSPIIVKSYCLNASLFFQRSSFCHSRSFIWKLRLRGPRGKPAYGKHSQRRKCPITSRWVTQHICCLYLYRVSQKRGISSLGAIL